MAVGRTLCQGSIADDYIKLAESLAPEVMCDASSYNAEGRAYPDVSALAQVGIPVCTSGKCFGVGGTSASAPTVGGVLSLINDARLNAGLKPLGFINSKMYSLMQDPTIYEECFADIGYDEIDSSWTCDTFSSCTGCDTGFPATKGWDPHTGFGQIKYEGFLKYFGKD